MSSPASARPSRLRFTPLALATGLIGTVLLALSLTGTVSAFTASIQNSTNTAGSGTLVMKETLSASSNPAATSGTVCSSTDGTSGVNSNSATCSTINKFGGDLAMTPGGPSSVVDIAIANTGSTAAKTFTLTPGATCTQSANGSVNGTATDLCGKMRVVITSGGSTVFTGTLASLAGATASTNPAITMPSAPAAGASVPFRFTVTLDSSAGNIYQGLSASLPMTWQFAG
jgi:hypothetical protein